MDFLIYAAVIACLFAVALGGIYVKRRLNVTQKEIETITIILNTIDYITERVHFKYKNKVSVIVKYCMEALDFILVAEFEDTQYIKELVCEKALDICRENQIELDDNTVDAVNMIVDYIVENYKNK